MRTLVAGIAGLAIAAFTAAADQPFGSMDALARAAHAEAAVKYCDSVTPPAAGRLALSQRIADETGDTLDAVLTEFHSIAENAITRIARDGCDSPEVAAMRQYYRDAAPRGFAGAQ